MSNRGAEIERFFWLLMRLAGTVFGWLMVLAGSVFALMFVVEQARTGAIAFNGQAVVEAGDRWRLIGTALAVVAGGYGLLLWCRRASD